MTENQSLIKFKLTIAQ